MSRLSAPANGWYVEVDLPGGQTITPDVVGSPSRNPTVNGYPSLELPVRKKRVWEEVDIENNTVPLRVWKDGQRQPVDEVETIRQGEGATQILKGRGGLEGETRVRKVVETDRVSNVVTDLVTNNTAYTANVDDAPTTVETLEVSSGDTESEWQNEFLQSDKYSPILAKSTLSIGDTEGVTVDQTAHLIEAEDFFGNQAIDDGSADPSGPVGSNNAGSLFSDGQSETTTVGFPYTVPASNVGVGIRYRNEQDPDSDGSYEGPAFEVNYAGETFISTSKDFGLGDDSFRVNTSSGLSSDLSTGSHTLELLVNKKQTSGANTVIDCVYVYDTRYHDGSSFDNTVTLNSAGDFKYLDNPTSYPTETTKANPALREFRDVTRVRAVVGGKISVTVNDASGIERLGLSKDEGETWSDSSSGVSSYSANFSGFGAELRWRVGLQGYGSRTNESPAEGFKAPELDSWSLDADLEDIPLVVNQEWDGSLDSILGDIAASFGDFIFEYRIDDQGNWSVEWTQPGLRTSSRDETVTQYQSETTAEQIVGKVVIKGGAIHKDGESFTANHGTAVSLDNEEIVRGSETVTDGSGTTFVAGEDYELSDPLAGEITTLSGGSMVDGNSYQIDYDYHPKDAYTSSTAPAGAPTITRTLTQLTTSRACGQVARLIGEEVETVLEEGQIIIPSDVAGWDVVSAIDFDVLPIDGNIEIRDVKNTPDRTVLLVGSRRTVDQVFSQVRQRLNALSSRA